MDAPPEVVVRDTASGQRTARALLGWARERGLSCVVLYEGTHQHLETVAHSGVRPDFRGLDNTTVVTWRTVEYSRSIDLLDATEQDVAEKISSESDFVLVKTSDVLALVDKKLHADAKWSMGQPILPAIGEKQERLKFAQAEALLRDHFGMRRGAFGEVPASIAKGVVWERERDADTELLVRDLVGRMAALRAESDKRPVAWQVLPLTPPVDVEDWPEEFAATARGSWKLLRI
ncbi:MAG: hypothetical protein KF858_09020 [Candidatus Sumerlaeia bacterium]|nr:hypothetical protein [Candidatus Sumerlaeia bacterium]